MSTMPRLCYIAGPMTGLPEFNAPAFDEKARELRASGAVVHNPAEIARAHGLDLADPDCLARAGLGLEVLVRSDIAALAQCRELHLLPGWELSKGTALELVVARAMGLLIVDEEA